jgi:hypothetical protein
VPFFLLAVLAIIAGAYYRLFSHAIVSLAHKIVKKNDKESQGDI